MTADEAKKLIIDALNERSLQYTRVSASKKEFERNTKNPFVTIRGWMPDPRFQQIQELANQNGFCVTTDYEG